MICLLTTLEGTIQTCKQPVWLNLLASTFAIQSQSYSHQKINNMPVKKLEAESVENKHLLVKYQSQCIINMQTPGGLVGSQIAHKSQVSKVTWFKTTHQVMSGLPEHRKSCFQVLGFFTSSLLHLFFLLVFMYLMFFFIFVLSSFNRCLWHIKTVW